MTETERMVLNFELRGIDMQIESLQARKAVIECQLKVSESEIEDD